MSHCKQGRARRGKGMDVEVASYAPLSLSLSPQRHTALQTKALSKHTFTSKLVATNHGRARAFSGGTGETRRKGDYAWMHVASHLFISPEHASNRNRTRLLGYPRDNSVQGKQPIKDSSGA